MEQYALVSSDFGEGDAIGRVRNRMLGPDAQAAVVQLNKARIAAFEDFTERLRSLTARPRANEANERFAKHLHAHGGEWFVFVLDPSVPATNGMGEQAIRPAVVNRKVWGGNRTDAGAEAQSITTSVPQTCRRQTIDALRFVSQTLRGAAAALFPSLRMA